MSRAAIALCAAAALAIGGWRLLHPPIDQRMKYELAEGQGHIDSCTFHEAYDAFRRAAALDGTDPRPREGMRRARQGIDNFDRHRRFAKGCDVSD